MKRFYTLRTVILSFFTGFAMLLSVYGSLAQGILDEQRPIIDDLKQQAQTLQTQIDKLATNDEALAGVKLKLDAVAKKLLDAGVAFRPRLTEINSRLEQLGAPPAAGQPPEPQLVIDERSKLATEKAQINAIIGETEDTSLTVNQMIAKIGNMRRDLFTQTMSQRVDINYSLGSEVADAASDQMVSLGRVVSSWWRFVISFKLNSFLAAAFFAFAAAFILQFGARHLLGNIYSRDPATEAPTYISRLSVAFWSTLIPSAAVGVFLATTYFFLNYFNVLRSDIAIISKSLFITLGSVYFIHRLGRAVLSPDMPNWRLIPVAPGPGRILVFLISATALTNGIDYFLTTVNQVLSSPLSLTVAKSLLATVLVGVLILAIATLRPIENSETGKVRSWPKPLRIFLIIIGLLPIAAALLGYIGLARYISQQIVVTGAFLVTMYLGFLTARAIAVEQAFVNTRIGQDIRDRFNLDDAVLDQLGLVAGILINLIVVLIGVPLVAIQLGFQWLELKTLFFRLMTGFQVGNISISLTGILSGVLLFAVGFMITRWFQGWLDNSVMARGRVDSGVRNSIRTVIGYMGLSLAAIFAVSAAGFNLSNLVLIASGLTLGIGFGLQNIVSNFVSGLILLAERPFKVGDWVEAGTVSGIVKKISVRATEVETFQRQSIIVPNSTLINGNVGNWTHRNKLGRIDVNVLVPYTDNPRRVHALLLEIVRGHPSVLKNPEPSVSLSTITDTALGFDVYAHLADITSSSGIKNELRFQIVERLAAEGIKVPPSQPKMTVNIPQMERLPGFMSDGDAAEASTKSVRIDKKPAVGSDDETA